MSKLLQGTHHICLRAKDQEQLDQVIHFYHEVLGMDYVRGFPGMAMLDTGDGTVMELCIGEAPTHTGSIVHFALRTDDVDACIAAVTAAGRPITMEPEDAVMPTDPPYPIRVAFTEGLLGESIEFFQER